MQSCVSDAVWLTTLAREVQLGKAARLEKSHLLSLPQGHDALRATLGLPFPQRRDAPVKTVATFTTLQSKAFGKEHPC